MKVNQEVLDTAVVVSVSGEVDTGTVATLTSRLDAALVDASEHPRKLLVVDLGGVTYFGSAGLNALLESYEKGQSAAVAVRLVAPNAEVVRPIEVTRLDTVLRPFATIADAIQGEAG